MTTRGYGDGLGERLGDGLGAFEGLAGALGLSEPEGGGEAAPLPDGLAPGEPDDGEADTLGDGDADGEGEGLAVGSKSTDGGGVGRWTSGA
jgi:hypothetical protein